MPKIYHDLQSNYHLQPVAIETTGVYGKSTAPFLSGLAKRLVDVSGDPSVVFLVAAFDVLITITAYHLPLACINV